MNTLVQTLFNGMALGSVYALVALGFCLVFKASGAVNFAHGSLLLLGGYLVAVLHEPLGFAGALAVAALGTAVAAALEALVLRRVAKANGPAVPTILTIGIDILLLTELARRIGGDVLGTGDPWGADACSRSAASPSPRHACTRCSPPYFWSARSSRPSAGRGGACRCGRTPPTPRPPR